MKKKSFQILFVLLICALVSLNACIPFFQESPPKVVTVLVYPPTETPEEFVTPVVPDEFLKKGETESTPTIVHQVIPSDPGESFSDVYDSDSSITASERRAKDGDDLNVNLFERPFNADTMDRYFAELDLQKASLSWRDGFVFATIQVKGRNDETNMLDGIYGIEFDLDTDGRGDNLILGFSPSEDWTTDRVWIWQDLNHNVGAEIPVIADPPQLEEEDGYETMMFNEGKGDDVDLAWARVSPLDQNEIWLAFKDSVMNGSRSFYWRAWADKGLIRPDWYDYNDHFTLEEAGSPLVELDSFYPIKAIFEVDNTCRVAVGFVPDPQEPAICAPLDESSPTPPPPLTVTPYYPWIITLPPTVETPSFTRTYYYTPNYGTPDYPTSTPYTTVTQRTYKPTSTPRIIKNTPTTYISPMMTFVIPTFRFPSIKTATPRTKN